MTGATGDLTPEAPDQAFEPGERREISDAEHHADVTVAQSHHTTAPSASGGDDAADEASEGEGAARSGAAEPHVRDSRIGGDELADHDEHF